MRLLELINEMSQAYYFLQVCMCAQRRLRSACASVQSDQSSQGTLWVAKHHENTPIYNFDPIKPNFYYIVKLGFRGVYIICLISAQNIGCGYSLEPPR